MTTPAQRETANFADKAFVLLQKCLPTRWLSSLIAKITRSEWVWFKNYIIKTFIEGYRISLDEAEINDPTKFASFNAFFTRSLKPDARPIEGDGDQWCSPVDGTMSQLGAINNNAIIQAKGINYSADELLDGLTQPRQFDGGSFCTIYLAPNNYHRIHMPFDGELVAWNYIPGRLFSVNPATARALPRVFARNERVGTLFNTPFGECALIMVGALFVGSMETVWAGQISPPHRKEGQRYEERKAVSLKKGEEMGRFNMGSTVILLAPKSAVSWLNSIQTGTTLRMGQLLANKVKPHA